jgi:hypothetical protein
MIEVTGSEAKLARAARKEMLRLIRQLARGECVVKPSSDGEMLVLGEVARAYSRATIRAAEARGLLRIVEGRASANPEASAFLRRALVEGDDDERFGGQHREIAVESVEVEGARQPVRRNLSESPLSALARIRDRNGASFLPEEAIAAGERLLADFTRAQLQPRVTASWEPRLASRGKGQAGGQAEIAESAMAARDRFARAVEAMGPELAGVAVDVCCFSKGLELVERERQWPVRSAKLMLRAALLALARHYAPPAPERRRRRHHWGVEDYRPVL